MCTHSEGKAVENRQLQLEVFFFFFPPQFNFCSDGEVLDLGWWIKVLELFHDIVTKTKL